MGAQIGWILTERLAGTTPLLVVRKEMGFGDSDVTQIVIYTAAEDAAREAVIQAARKWDSTSDRDPIALQAAEVGLMDAVYALQKGGE